MAVKDIVADPKKVQFLERWSQGFERSYDLTSHADRMALVEGLSEIGKHVATASETASLAIDVGQNGVVGVRLSATPIQS